MDAQPLPPHPAHEPVPDALMKQLNDANHEFHASKEHLEAELDSYEPDLARRLEPRREELKAAERKLEEVTQRIHETIEGERQS